jgi:outer membrane immunogenic protein
MARLVLSFIAGLTLVAVGPALAADLPVKSAPLAPTPTSSWTGVYVGANVGYAWGTGSSGGISDDMNGVIGGGQLGYNWQSGPLVLGVEGDIQASGQKNSDTATLAGIRFTLDREVPWFATLRGRIGYASGPWLIYGTGGAAWGNYKITISALGTSASDDTTKTAWTGGGGVEWMFAPKWSAKLEYLYIDTGNTDVTLFGTTFSGRLQDNVVRAGVNYHF